MCAAKMSLTRDILSSAVLGAVGDICTQLGIERRRVSEVDARRVVALTSFNAIYIGGFLHFLYRGFPLAVTQLGRWTRQRTLSDRSTPTHAAAVALIDNWHNGCIYIPAYYVAVGRLEGTPLPKACDNLKEAWWSTYLSCSRSTAPHKSHALRRRILVPLYGAQLRSGTARPPRTSHGTIFNSTTHLSKT